ncbi:MAG: phosphoglycolate phosphatase [Anaerolineales bacterium]
MKLDLARIQALCFDVDGTLSDTDDLYVEKFLPLFRFARHPARAARRFVMWAEAPGNLLMGVPDYLGLDDELHQFYNWLNQRFPPSLKHFRMIGGVREMLEQLAPHYPMAVVSARDDRTTRAFLDQFDLTPFFQVIVTAVTAEHTKPYPDPIYFAAHKMGVQPENCLMIGDTTVDMRAGKSAGAQTVGVLCGFGERAELQKAGANLILEQTPDLTKALKP